MHALEESEVCVCITVLKWLLSLSIGDQSVSNRVVELSVLLDLRRLDVLTSLKGDVRASVCLAQKFL